MKVLRVSNAGGDGRIQMGGAERGLLQQVPFLLNEGIEVVVVVPSGEVAARLHALGVRVIEAGPTSRIDRRYIARLRRVIRSERPDVIHLQLLSASVHGRFAARLSGIKAPVIVSLHNDLVEIYHSTHGLPGRASVLLNGALERFADVVRPSVHVAVGGPELEHLRRPFLYKDARLLVNELPQHWTRSNQDERAATRRSLGVGDDTLLFGAFMRFERSKGADLLWTVAPHLPGLLLACGEGTLSPPIHPSIMALPYEPDVRALMSACDVIVVPSRVESFGRTAVEALALGVPILHTGAGGLSWVTDGAPDRFARRFASGDADDLVRKAEEMARDRETENFIGLGCSASDLMDERFGFLAGVEAWKRLYQELGGDQ